jgi:hypothetical protein
MLKKPSKKLWVRFIEGGRKLSVGEYLRAKWHNTLDPFDLNDMGSVSVLVALIEAYKKREKRDVEFVSYGGSAEALDTLNAMVKRFDETRTNPSVGS